MKDIKASFAKEKDRHAAAVQALEQELATAQETAQADQLAIQKAADMCFLSRPASSESNDAWNAMMAVDDDGDGMPAVPREVWEYMAQAAMQMRGQSAAAPTGGPPGPPPIPPPTAAPPAPPVPLVQRQVEAALAPTLPDYVGEHGATGRPAYSAMSPSPSPAGARVAPYATMSPLPHHPVPDQVHTTSEHPPNPAPSRSGEEHTSRPEANAQSKGPGDGSLPRPGAHPPQNRAGVKDMTKGLPAKPDVQGPSLSAKLEAERASETSVAPDGPGPAMMPFRGAGPPGPTTRDGLPAEPAATGHAMPEGSAPEVHMIAEEDGPFEELSPGFANLE